MNLYIVLCLNLNVPESWPVGLQHVPNIHQHKVTDGDDELE